ncbi:MAG TPA: LysR family transcriptional regulator [Polyangium sp.]|nr:LysR family transcriptional regulator [Polyangium sp.]
MSDPIETAELLAFARTIEAKSLSRAAAELRIPRATLGRRLARLEERLGTRLLQRTTRSLALTDAGELFYRHARIVIDAVLQAEASVQRTDDVVRGDLRVSIPPLMDDSLMAMITSYAEKYPAVRVQIDVSTRLVDLRREGFDVALRASTELQPGLIARTIRREKVIAVASPAYLARMGTPRTAKDLRNHRCLTGFARGELPQASWPAGKGSVRVDGAFSSNDLRLVRDAALRGLGIAMIPHLVLGDLVERGVLVQVLPKVLETEHRVSVVYLEREFTPPHVRAFVEAMVTWAPSLGG